MKETKYICDVCKSEFIEKLGEKKNIKMQVIFETEQNEGRSCNPYFEYMDLDLCHNCLENCLEGNYIFAIGAMGHNKYGFKKK